MDVTDNRNATKPASAIASEVTGAVSDHQQVKPLLPSTRPRPGSWPTTPNKIQNGFLSIAPDLLVDVLLLTLSIAFLVFALVVWYLNGSAVNEHQHTVNLLLDLAKYGPSIFPILFACVLGRATHAILIWTLQVGERVGTLDLLADSTSFTTTIFSQFGLGISLLGIVLVAVWGFSPVGGQASLRQITIGTGMKNDSTSLRYFERIGNLTGYDNSYHATSLALPNALFTASIYAPSEIKLSTIDTWGNVKIPMIEPYERTVDADDQGWYSVSAEPSYSALVGIPMTKVNPPVTHYEARIESSYFHLDCPNIAANMSRNGAHPESVIGLSLWVYSPVNDTQRALSVYHNDTGLKPREFYIGDWDGALQWGALHCFITTTYVEAEAQCGSSATCSVTRIRRSTKTHLPAALTLMDQTYGNMSLGYWNLTFNYFLNVLPGHPAYANALTFYLEDTLEDGVEDLQKQADTSAEGWSFHLSQLLNTYWNCIDASGKVSTPLLSNDTAASNTTAMTALTFDVVNSHRAWTITLCIASLIMIVAVLVRFTFTMFLIHGPDLKLNISSLALRDNSHVSLPSTGSYLTGSEIAKLARKMKVKHGDVASDGQIGRLSIASLDSDQCMVASVRKDRMYE